MAFRQFCPVVNDAFAFLDAFIKNQTGPRSAHYPLLEHNAHDYVRSVKWVIRAFTYHLSRIDAELSYDNANYTLLDYKQLVEYFKDRGIVAEFQNHRYWSRNGRAFSRMMKIMMDDWLDYDDDVSMSNEDWFDTMCTEFKCGFIAFTECLELLCELIAKPIRTTRYNYQSGAGGNWCILDSSDACNAFSRLYQVSG